MSDEKTRIQTRNDEPLISLQPGTRLAEYEIIKTLGIGGFGITYLARDTNLHKEVAVKEYFPTHLAFRDSELTVHPRQTQVDDTDLYQWGLNRVIQEARAIAQFDHPNLIRVARYFEANGTAYIVMDFVAGPSLKQLIRTEQGMDEARFSPLLSQLMDGLEVVHNADLLHRDIKPINIIVRDGLHPILIDFGAAKQTIGNQATVATAFQSMGYTPLEQLGSAGKLGPYTDIYALAATAYTALTGKPPADCNDRVIADCYVPALQAAKGKASEAFLRAIDWGLEIKYQDRPQSVAEWREAFIGNEQTCIRIRPQPVSAAQRTSSQPASTEIPPTDVLPAHAPGNRRWLWPTTALALCLAAGAGWYGLHRFAASTPVPQQPHESKSASSAHAATEPTPAPPMVPAVLPTAKPSIANTHNQQPDPADQEDFDTAVFIDTPEAYELYLRLHPKGIYASTASQKIQP